MDDDLLPYYFFIVDVEKDTWRPAPTAPKLPRDKWLMGKASLSYTSKKRWLEPLCRFLVTSVITAEYSKKMNKPSIDLANASWKASMKSASNGSTIPMENKSTLATQTSKAFLAVRCQHPTSLHFGEVGYKAIGNDLRTQVPRFRCHILSGVIDFATCTSHN